MGGPVDWLCQRRGGAGDGPSRKTIPGPRACKRTRTWDERAPRAAAPQDAALSPCTGVPDPGLARLGGPLITALTSWLAGAEPAAVASAALAGGEAAGGVQSIGTPALWTGFTVTVAIVMAVDLFFMSRSDGAMSKRAAVRWTAVWVSTALLFAAAIWFVFPHPDPELTRARTMEFLAAYLIEYSLSVDNLFVFMLLFHAFRVPEKFQPRVLFWGIFGAVVLRGIFIFAGTALLQRFHFLIYLFGAFLIYTGATLVFGGDDEGETDVSQNRVVRLAKRFIRVSDSYDGHKFFTVQNGIRVATPLMLVLTYFKLYN